MKVMLYGSPVGILRDGLTARLGDVSFVEAGYADGADVVADRLHGCSAVVAVRMDGSVTLPGSVKLVQVPGIGTDEIAVDALPPWVTLCNVGEHGPAVAEYVIGALLARATGLCATDAAFRAGSWEASSRMGGAPHRELFGARAGIIGFGQIGREIARRLGPFGVRVEVCNRSKVTEAEPVDRYWPMTGLTEMAAGCDILIVTVALTPVTQGIIGREVLGALPEGAVVVNVARGPIVDEDALYEALSREHLGGAVLDVWWQYPETADGGAVRPSRHDFTQFPGVVVTPHISGWSGGTVSRRLDVIADNLRGLSKGRALSNVVRRGG